MADKSKHYEQNSKWNKANTLLLTIRLVKTTEQDLIEWLNSQPNKSGYVKALIRKDMEDKNA